MLVPEGMALEEVVQVATDAIVAQREYNVYSRTYHHRPGDGAVAVNAVMHHIYGQFLGKRTWVQDPQLLDVEVSPGIHKSVPWGQCKMDPSFGTKAIMLIDETSDHTYGTVLKVSVSAIKKAQEAVEQIFDMIEEHLRRHSIYRGQAIYASDVPKFIDVSAPSREVVFTETTTRRLDFRLFSIVDKEHIHLELGNDGKQIIWIYGDYGTGKSEILDKLTRKAQHTGCSVIHVRPSVDKWDHALQLAKMLAPRVFVIVEDAESVTGVERPLDVAKMLDQLDGVDAKMLSQTTFVFTTNFIERVQKAATRPGRADAIIRLGNLDRKGCEALVRLEVGDMLADDVDFDEVYIACGGEGRAETEMTPAFMRKAFGLARDSAAFERGLYAKVSTENLLDGIEDMQEQLAIYRSAPEPKPSTTVEQLLVEALAPMVQQMMANELYDYSSTVYERAHEAADAVVEHRIHGVRITAVDEDGDETGPLGVIRTN
jgi:hypothetical protein